MTTSSSLVPFTGMTLHITNDPLDISTSLDGIPIANEHLRHSVHAITRSITPKLPLAQTSPALTSPGGNAPVGFTYPNPGVLASGLEHLETEKFRLTCFQTLTGTKFLLFTDPMTGNVDTIMNKIYELYADYVMKNPFYQLEMPVRCEAFDRHLGAWLRGRT